MKTISICAGLLLVSVFASVAAADNAKDKTLNAYKQINFVANKEKYEPTLGVEKNFINGWGIAIRPKGAGGHFWVAAKDASYEYVGDVQVSPDEALRILHQDPLKIVKLPVGGDENVATGVVFSDSDKNFVITQEIPGLEPITAPAKFLFASDGGVISAWTERKLNDGTFDRSGKAETVIDQSGEGAQFFGLTLSHDYEHLYAADFGKNPSVKIFDGTFKPVAMTFDMPFDDNKNGKVDAGEYAPFNVQALATPSGENHIFVTYAKTQTCPAEEVKKATCEDDALFVGEEDTTKPGYGRVAEFSEDGKLIHIWNDGNKLSAPWGIVYAPPSFGALSNTLLVANFGDGMIAAFNPDTRTFVDFIRSKDGKPVVIDKIWGLLFGNGESLGDANALYFSAGPDDEKDGLFGSLRPAP